MPTAIDKIQSDRAAVEAQIAAAKPGDNINYLIQQLDLLKALDTAGATGALATDATAQSIGTTAHADAVALLAAANAIAANTAADKFEFVPLEDANGTVFYNKIDRVAGTATPLTLALAPFTPAQPVTIAPPDTAGVPIATVFEAKTAGADWLVGDPLRRLEQWKGATLSSSAWVNDRTGAVLSNAPIFGTDIENQQDLALTRLSSIDSKLSANLANDIAAIRSSVGDDKFVLTTNTRVDTFGMDLLTGTVNGWYPVSEYNSLCLQLDVVGNLGSGSVFYAFEATNSLPDIGGYIYLENQSDINNSSGITSFSKDVVLSSANAFQRTRFLVGNLGFKWFRIRQYGSQSSSGATIQLTATFSKHPLPPKHVHASVIGSVSAYIEGGIIDEITIANSLPAGANTIGKVGIDSANNTVALTATQITALTPPSNTGYSTAALQTAGNSSLANIDTTMAAVLTELRDDINVAETIWKDTVSGAFFVRELAIEQDNGVRKITWRNPNGTVATPTLANLALATADKDFEIATALWRATAASTGVTIGDIIESIALLDAANTASSTVVWVNITTRLMLATVPAAANLSPLAGDASAALQATGNASLSNIDGKLTGKAANAAAVAADPSLVVALSPNSNTIDLADRGATPAADDTGTFSLMAYIKRISGTITNLLTRFPGAIALNDAIANPTTSLIGAAQLLFDGTNYRRAQSGSRSNAQSAAVALPKKAIVSQTIPVTTANLDLLTNTVNGWFDATEYSSVVLDLDGAIVPGTLVFEQTNNPLSTTGTLLVLDEENASTTVPTASFTLSPSTKRVFRGDIAAAYIRVRASIPFASGTVALNAAFSQMATPRTYQTITNSNLTSLDTKIPTLGQKVSAGSVSTTIASDQSPIPTSARTILPNSAIDIVSAVITTTTTTAAIIPNFGDEYEVMLDLGAISGTAPTCSVAVQESLDGGTRWRDVYTFPTLGTADANTQKYSGKLRLQGNRIRYVRTIGGTTPSFTMQIARLETNSPGGTYANQGKPVNGTITAANTAQSVTLFLPARRSLTIQNNSATDMWVRWDSANATVNGGSLRIPANATWDFPPNAVPRQMVFSILSTVAGGNFVFVEG